MYIAHGPIAYLSNELIQKRDIQKLDSGKQVLVSILSFIFGICVDFDLFIMMGGSTPAFQHHMYYFHTVYFWIGLWILFTVLILLIRKVFVKRFAEYFDISFVKVVIFTFIISTASHLFADLLFSYNGLLYPVLQQFTLFGSLFKVNYFAGFFYSPSMSVELFFVITFFIHVYTKYLKNTRVVSILLRSLQVFSVLYFVFCAYINLNTYNMSVHMQNGHTVYDNDYDGLIDSRDMDTDNDGVNNIDEVDPRLLVLSVNTMVKSNMLVSSDGVLLRWGAFNSYRVVSQAFYNQNLAIEPVLNTYFKSTNAVSKYDLDISYPDELYSYYMSKGSLRDMDSVDEYLGNIFFVMDSNDGVENMGIFLNSSTVVCVFSDDTRIKTHTTDELVGRYSKENILVNVY